MKRIIDPKPYPLYVTFCYTCKCRFEYEEEDIANDFVLCPNCESVCMHFSSNIKQ